MPLVRYEVRCEHSLANPELYRSAARDDPESLLEGVAMAGLVGIVRQLGDLAEFAAEIFCSLHDELMTIGSRGHDLNMRVQQLEDELPVVEKALLSEPNQLRFAYTNGADWHASIRSDQNHCTSGDLPRFVRNYYEECRGPPQLFLLDKFDVSGVGACLKRYTDPSFFKLEWASTELMRAQREQRDKRARRDKKKGRKRRTGEPIAAINQIPARVRYGSASLEDLEGLPHDIASALKVDVPVPSRLSGLRESGTLTPRGPPRGAKDILGEAPISPALKPTQVSAISNTLGGVKYSSIGVTDLGNGDDSGNVLKLSEPEGTASSLVGKISRIIDQEDRAAAPAKDLPRALDSKASESTDGFGDAGDNGHAQSLESKAANGISQDNLGGTGMPRSVRTSLGTPRGTARGEFAIDARAGEKRSPGKSLFGADSPMLLQSSSRRSIYMDALDSGRLSGKFLWRQNADGSDPTLFGGRISRQVSIARSGSEYDEFVDAPSRIVSEGESDFDSPGSVHKATHFNGDVLNHTALKNHVETQKGEIPSGVKLKEQQRPFPTADKPEDSSAVVPKDYLQPADDDNARDLLNRHSPVPTVVKEDPTASPVSSGRSGAPVGDALAPIQQSEEPKSDKAVSSNRIGDSRMQEVPIKHDSRTTEMPSLMSLVGASPTHSSLGSPSSATSPSHAPQDVLKPSISMFSRHSYSSELISVSSDSEPNSPTSLISPTSPNSPAFHALYSPRGEPRSMSYTVKSPPSTHLGSLSPGTAKSNGSCPSLDEVPVLSQSPTSVSRSSCFDLDLGEGCRPPAVIPANSESKIPSRPRLQLYPLPTPPSMSPEGEKPSKSREFSYPMTGGFGGPDSPPENGALGHANGFDEDGVHLDLQLSPTSKPGDVIQVEEPLQLDESVPPPTTGSKTGAVPSSPEIGTRVPASSEPMMSPLVLPRVVDNPVPSAPSSPVGSPSVPASLSPRRTIPDDGNLFRSLGDEEDSNPSSPSGSVIIKDSPPESPRSSYSGSECESRDFDAIQGRPETSGTVVFTSNVLEESVAAREAGVEEVASIVSLRSKSSDNLARTSLDKVQSPLLSPASHSSAKHSERAVEISTKFSLDSLSNGSADESASQERISPSGSPFIRPQVDPLPTTLKPISTARPTTKSYKSLTSNSPPDSPPGREEQSTNIPWRGKSVPPSTPPRGAFKLSHHPPLRSPLRSPMLTPKSLWSETGTLKWLGRLDPGLSPKPDFSLPPNLVPNSEASSPVCSPPPQLDLDSPSKSSTISEPSADLDSPHIASTYRLGVGEENRLPELSYAQASTSFAVAGGFSGFSSLRHDSEEDYVDEAVRQNEPERVELSATSNSGPSHSSSSSHEDAPSSDVVDPEEFRVLTRVAEIEQLSVPIGGAVSEKLSSATSGATVSAPDENSSESDHGANEVDHSIERSEASSSREAEGSQELGSFPSADAKVRYTDSQQAPPASFEEPESTSKSGRASNANVCVSSQRGEALSATSSDGPANVRERFDETDISVASGNLSSAQLDREHSSLGCGPANDADVGAAHGNEKAAPVPLENAEPVIEAGVGAGHQKDASPSSLENAESANGANVGAAHADETVSSSLLEKAERSRDFESVNATGFVGAARFESQEPVVGPNTASGTGMDKKVLPSPSTPEPGTSDESTALHRTEVLEKVHSVETASTPPVADPELRTTPNTKAAIEAAILRHDRNMLKELTFQDPVLRPRPTDERSLFIDQMRTTSFNLRRTESMEKKELVARPVANINVAAILEKANAIRQAFAGSDDDDDGDDDWSDS